MSVVVILNSKGLHIHFVIGDANLESLRMVGETIVDDVLSYFLSGQREEHEVFVVVIFHKRDNLYFMVIVMGVPHDALKYVGSRVISEYFTLKV